MQRKPPYMATEETEDCSSEQQPRTHQILNLEQTSITDVWADNFHEQIDKITHLSKTYNIIAIDTEFPSIEEYNERCYHFSQQTQAEKYLRLTKNVDSTQVIQLGLSIADEYGNVPDKFCWQFNFKYETDIQQISAQSGYILKKAGIKFENLRSHGIPYKTFIHEFIKSGLLLNKKNRWVVFHGGYDFLYLLKLIRNEASPKAIDEFYKSIKIYFPQKIDLKLLIHKEKRLKKLGLSKLADTILCRRIGPQHQAGSDSLLTLQCYFKLRQQFEHLYENLYELENIVYGIGTKELTKHDKNFYKEYSHHRPQQYQSYGYTAQNYHYQQGYHNNGYFNMGSYNNQHAIYYPYGYANNPQSNHHFTQPQKPEEKTEHKKRYKMREQK